jgi:hypothetical protein
MILHGILVPIFGEKISADHGIGLVSRFENSDLVGRPVLDCDSVDILALAVLCTQGSFASRTAGHNTATIEGPQPIRPMKLWGPPEGPNPARESFLANFSSLPSQKKHFLPSLDLPVQRKSDGQEKGSSKKPPLTNTSPNISGCWLLNSSSCFEPKPPDYQSGGWSSRTQDFRSWCPCSIQ